MASLQDSCMQKLLQCLYTDSVSYTEVVEGGVSINRDPSMLSVHSSPHQANVSSTKCA